MPNRLVCSSRNSCATLGKQGIERVQQVRLPFDPFDAVQFGVGELRRDRRRHVAGETLQHGRHAQLALSRQDLVLQFLVPFDPAGRQRPAPAVQAAHPLERQERRPGQKRGDLGVAHPQPLADRLPDRFLAGDRQRHVHAVQGHPVDQFLPLVPVPPRQRVAEAAVVQEVAILRPSDLPDFRCHRRQRIGQVQLAAVQRDVAMAEVIEVPVQPRGHGNARVAANHHSVAARFDLEHIPAVFRRQDLEFKPVRVLGQQPLQQAAGGVRAQFGSTRPGQRSGVRSSGRKLTSAAWSRCRWASSRIRNASKLRSFPGDQSTSAKAQARGYAMYCSCFASAMYSLHSWAWAPSTCWACSAVKRRRHGLVPIDAFQREDPRRWPAARIRAAPGSSRSTCATSGP